MMVTKRIAKRLSHASVVITCAAVPLLAVPSIIGVNGLKPVSSLPEQSRIRRASSGVGKLEFVGDDGQLYTCTAALISPVYVLTVAHCWSPGSPATTLVLGFMSRSIPGKRFRLKSSPAEISKELDYVILPVEGEPITEFDPAVVLMREPTPNEDLYILQHPQGDPLTYSANCKVVPGVAGEDRERYLPHTCSTTGGSSGALVFSLRDNAVLGLQALGFSPGEDRFLYNRAVPLVRIASVSPIVRGLAWVRSSQPAYETVLTAPTADVKPNFEPASFGIDADLRKELNSQTVVAINGNKISVKSSGDDEIAFLGGMPSPGLNVITTAKDSVFAWLEERKLSNFEKPYKNSYAVLVAIDDYQRLNDQKKRGKTGFGQLGQMVPKAEELRKELVNLGFANQNIVSLYDQKAESGAIEQVLKSFWPGGERSGADRVFVYFGGHGSAYNGAGLLVTYDYDATQPTLTTLLMRDLTTRQSENIAARHVIIVLDACSSGLAIQSLADPDRDKRERARFRALSVIRNDATARARNVLVAGTGDEPALYDNGGIFTNALIAGLKGAADLNGDRIIEFGELGVFVRGEVAVAANQKSIQQTAGYYKLTSANATGEVVFIPGEQR